MLIVEMARGQMGQPDFLIFELTSKSWKALLDLAWCFGWMPQGVLSHGANGTRDSLHNATSDYKVESWSKHFSDEDARSLSSALYAALEAAPNQALEQQEQILIIEGMSADDFERINSSAYDSLLMFARFTANGGFVFAWDD